MAQRIKSTDTCGCLEAVIGAVPTACLLVDRRDVHGMYSHGLSSSCSFCAMTNLDAIPAPGPDCTAWRESPNKRGFYRLYGGPFNPRVQFADADGGVLVVELNGVSR